VFECVCFVWCRQHKSLKLRVLAHVYPTKSGLRPRFCPSKMAHSSELKPPRAPKLTATWSLPDQPKDAPWEKFRDEIYKARGA
jgi:hypothetical protein